MRRKDREMNSDFGMKLIDKAAYGVLSMVDGDKAYSIPLSLVRKGDVLYFHSAKEGRKVDLLAKNPKVSIVFVGATNIPENYSPSELENMNKDPLKAGKFISSVFTTEFESAIVEGQVEKVEDSDEQIKALRITCEKYTPDKMDFFASAIKAGLARTNVYKVKIGKITAKRKKYDGQGMEMKWGRTE